MARKAIQDFMDSRMPYDKFLEQLKTHTIDQQIELIQDRLNIINFIMMCTDKEWDDQLEEEIILLNEMSRKCSRAKFEEQQIKLLPQTSKYQNMQSLLRYIRENEHQIDHELIKRLQNDIDSFEFGWKTGVCQKCYGVLSKQQIKKKKNNCDRASCVSIEEECEVCLEQIMTEIIRNDKKECPVCFDSFLTNTNTWQQFCCGDFRHIMCLNCSDRLQSKCCVLCQKSPSDKVRRVTKYDIGLENQPTGYFYGLLETIDKQIPQETLNSIYLNIIRYQKCINKSKGIGGDRFIQKAKQLIDQYTE